MVPAYFTAIGRCLLTTGLLPGLLLALGLLPWTTASAAPVSDVRVLVDVSGSMKKNDPNNLRAPAVNLLVGLLPPGTRAGVWTFGRYVNMAVDVGEVNGEWKRRARAEADKIHSRGLFTNIEEAVAKASADWQQRDPAYDRHMILLTDGMVDIAKDDAVNAESRRRLLQETLPRLEDAGVTVHTIALSKNVDFELLYALSGATGGAYEQVDNADQLQRVFLKLFEKSVQADALPLIENRFSVDKHVSDITVLAFLAPDSAPTRLHTPDGAVISQDNKPAGVQWHHEQGYDLITIPEPAVGEWALEAKVDPDNRVMVVTNLGLKLDKLPNNLMLGDELSVKARLLEDGKVMSNPDILQRTQFTVAQTPGGSTKPMRDDGEAPDVLKGDAVYSARVDKLGQGGEYELVVRAEGMTFEREVRHALRVYDTPATLGIERKQPDGPFTVSITPHVGLIRPESVSMQITLPQGEPQVLEQVAEMQWARDVPGEFAGQTFTVTLVGTRYNGKSVKQSFEQVLAVNGAQQQLVMDPPPAKEPPEEKPAAPEADDQEAESPPTEPQEADAANAGFDWTFVIILVVVINLIVFVGGYFAWRFWQQRKVKADAEEEEEMQV